MRADYAERDLPCFDGNYVLERITNKQENKEIKSLL
jgi:hypothetical protein